MKTRTKAQIIPPFHGKPKTRRGTDAKGRLTLTVTPRSLGPLRARVADGLGNGCTFGVAVAGFYQIGTIPEPTGWLWLAPLIAAALTEKPLKWAWRWALKTRTRVVFTKDDFQMKDWTGWKRFSRKEPHRFALLNHDHMPVEKERHELEIRQAQARGEVISKHRYYGESAHIALIHAAQRYDVLTVYGLKDARQIFERLQFCDLHMNELAGLGDGVALDPSDQWNTQPGEL